MAGSPSWLEATEFLTHEARLLDQRRFDEWLALFTDDAVYWVPAKFGGADPMRDVSIVYDDRQRLGERVLRLQSRFNYAQDPPSRTCHVIGSVEATPDGDDLTVASAFVVTEVRRGTQTVYSGFADHTLVRDGTAWRIRHKTVWLLNCDLPLGNVTFLL